MENSGVFISLEGIDGVGKSTHLTFIHDYLSTAGRQLLMTREPGGTDIAESIREVLLSHNDEQMLPDTELLLMFAARSQHLHNVIKPALAEGKWVVSDRFVDASYAYQGGGRNVAIDKIAFLDQWIVNDCKPNVTFLLDAPVDIALKRTQERSAQDRFDKENIEFYQRLRQSYLERARAEAERFKIIDASLTIPEIQANLRVELRGILDA